MWATTTLLLLFLVASTQASGVFELRLKSFANENGKDSLGKCCSGEAPGPSGQCPGKCRTRFRVCLKQYQANIDTTTPCTYGDVVTPVLGDNSLNLTNSHHHQPSFTNPIRFPFDFTWPGTFSLIVEAFHDTADNSTHGSSGSSSVDRVIITRLATQRWLDVGPEWIEDEHRSHHSMMVYEYRVTCAAHYYGKGCENLCRPRDDHFGHYRCSPTGERVCLSGWKGDYCATPHCLAGCDEQHGHCSRPNECTCHNGWTGQFCDQCVRYPGCLHGSCQKPWECLCDEGWGGLFCNQDLNFCTNHKPCRNGGTCFNTGQGSYTCQCAPGFAGTDCQTPLLDCSAQPCLNSGTCQPTTTTTTATTSVGSNSSLDTVDGVGRRYKCACPAGWRGRHCEVSSRSCKDGPCSRGATCVDDSERGYTCLCPAGFAGPDCEQQIDECAPNPCANGGTCSDLVAGFSCSCPSGFTGERCQTNIDDCQGEPCLNGGSCVDLVNKFRCQCVPGFVGRLCQDEVDYCLAKPCSNGGSCTSTTNDYSCACKPGFSGKDCSVDVDECKSSPCQHGGQCRNRVNGFACDCPDGWRGETCAEPQGGRASASAGYWTAPVGPGHARPGHEPAHHQQPEQARHAALSTEHVVVIATISTAVPGFVLVAALAVVCMKRRQKREQAKADEEARLQNERNAVHSSMSKRAAAMLSPRPMEQPMQQQQQQSQQPQQPNCGGGSGDSHMIKNTWTANGVGPADRAKSCNNVVAAADGSMHDGYKPEPVVPDARGCARACTKQLNTEAAALRASQQTLSYHHKDKECGSLAVLASSCHQLLDSKRASSLFSAATDSASSSASCCAESLKRPPDDCSVSSSQHHHHQQQQANDSTCSGVYCIDDHYSRHDSLATQV